MPTPLDKYTQQVLGFDLEADRLDVLPYPAGALDPNQEIDWSDWTLPQWAFDLGKAGVAPGFAAQGGQVSQEDAMNVAMNFMGTGLLAGRAAPVVGGGYVAPMFAGVKAGKADLGALKKADKLLAEGVEPFKVWQETGWLMGRMGSHGLRYRTRRQSQEYTSPPLKKHIPKQQNPLS